MSYYIIPSRFPLRAHQSVHLLVQLSRVFKDIPNIVWHAFKSLCKSLWRILLALVHLRHAGDLADIDRSYPLGEHTICLAVRLWVGLSAVADDDEFALGEPGVDLLDAVDLVGLRALREIGKEASEVHPGGLSEDHGSWGIVGVSEFAQERIQVVWRGR